MNAFRIRSTEPSGAVHHTIWLADPRGVYADAPADWLRRCQAYWPDWTHAVETREVATEAEAVTLNSPGISGNLVDVAGLQSNL